jgi:hypothetical protein
MADLNPWVIPGAGLLDGQVFQPIDPWQQMVRATLGRRARPIPSTGVHFDPNGALRAAFWPDAGTTAQPPGPWRTFTAPSPFAFERSRITQPPAEIALSGSTESPSTAGNPEDTSGLLPVGYNDAIRRPPWWHPPSLGELWLDQSIKGGQGLINFFRSRSGGSRPRQPERDLCYERYQAELNECNERREDMVHKHHYSGCTERARDRWDICNKNGYPNGPGEPRKWGDGDEEVWFNQGR